MTQFSIPKIFADILHMSMSALPQFHAHPSPHLSPASDPSLLPQERHLNLPPHDPHNSLPQTLLILILLLELLPA